MKYIIISKTYDYFGDVHISSFVTNENMTADEWAGILDVASVEVLEYCEGSFVGDKLEFKRLTDE